MSKLDKIIADVQKKLKVNVKISPERMKILQSVLDGKISPEDAKKAIQTQYEEAEDED